MKYWPVPNSYSKNLPLKGCASFAEDRDNGKHCGVDIYAPKGCKVVSIENGVVIARGIFTSPKIKPYWHTTYYVAIRGDSGFINKYCELKDVVVKEGDKVKSGQLIGHIGEVLNFKKINKGSPLYIYIQKLKESGVKSMLHFELYAKEPVVFENYSGGIWFGDIAMPKNLLNPTKYLLSIAYGSSDLGFDIGYNALKIERDNLNALKRGRGKIRFTGAYIHLAPICNFRCEGCFTYMEIKRGKRLNFNVIKRIIDFAKDRGAQFIIFAGAGEPTLDPEFKEIVNYIKKQNLQIVLFTNLSTLKNKKQAKDFLESGPVVAKLYTLNEKKYNKITHCKNAFKYAMRGLKLLLEAKRDLEKQGKKVILALDSYITKENYEDLPNLLRYCRENRITPYFSAFIELGQPRNIVRKLAVSEKTLAQLFLKLQKIDKEEFGINTFIYPWSRRYGEDRCRKATHMFSVRGDGNVYMCVCTLRKVGNIFDQKTPYQSLEKIFNAKNKWLLNYFMCDKCSKLINPKYLN